MTESNLANSVYDARIEAENGSILRKTGEWISAVADAFFGGTGTHSFGVDVVIRRIKDDAEVLRLDAGGIEECEIVCDDIEKSLAKLSVEEFETAWSIKS